MRNFSSSEAAAAEGFAVTHTGHCGACSSLQVWFIEASVAAEGVTVDNVEHPLVDVAAAAPIATVAVAVAAAAANPFFLVFSLFLLLLLRPPQWLLLLLLLLLLSCNLFLFPLRHLSSSRRTWART